jgi:hypothetical protein
MLYAKLSIFLMFSAIFLHAIFSVGEPLSVQDFHLNILFNLVRRVVYSELYNNARNPYG